MNFVSSSALQEYFRPLEVFEMEEIVIFSFFLNNGFFANFQVLRTKIQTRRIRTSDLLFDLAEFQAFE